MFNVYAIRDLKAECFNTPFFFQTDGLARRAFQDLVNDERSVVHAHPEDFVLYCVGTWDDISGELCSFVPRHIVKASDYIIVEKCSENDVLNTGVVE